MTIHDELIAEINAFLFTHKMAKSAFGFDAMGDYGFVFDVEKGRSLQIKTVEKVRAFMRNTSPEQCTAIARKAAKARWKKHKRKGA